MEATEKKGIWTRQRLLLSFPSDAASNKKIKSLLDKDHDHEFNHVELLTTCPVRVKVGYVTLDFGKFNQPNSSVSVLKILDALFSFPQRFLFFPKGHNILQAWGLYLPGELLYKGHEYDVHGNKALVNMITSTTVCCSFEADPHLFTHDTVNRYIKSNKTLLV